MALRKPIVLNNGEFEQLQSSDSIANVVPPGGLVPGGRLTLSSGDPCPTSDVTGVNTVYYTPYLHSFIDLYDTGPGLWRRFNFAEKSFSLPITGVATPIDIFGVITSDDLALAEAVWTNDTTRATALVRQDGYWFLGSGSPPYNHLYLGTVRTTGANNVTEDSVTKRFLWNAFNRVKRPVRKTSTASYAYNTATFRATNLDTTFRVESVCGLAGCSYIDLQMLVFLSRSAATFAAVCGIGEGSTTVSTSLSQAFEVGIAGAGIMSQALVRKNQPVGYQYYQAMEQGGGSGTTSWFHSADRGLHGWVEA